MDKAVFLTGSTGFRRMRIVSTLLKETEKKIFALVRAKDIGGAPHTTTLVTGKAVRYDGALKELGIDLDGEFKELYQDSDHHGTGETDRPRNS